MSVSGMHQYSHLSPRLRVCVRACQKAIDEFLFRVDFGQIDVGAGFEVLEQVVDVDSSELFERHFRGNMLGGPKEAVNRSLRLDLVTAAVTRRACLMPTETRVENHLHSPHRRLVTPHHTGSCQTNRVVNTIQST